MSSSEQVFTGFWTNWEKGRVLGATLTLRNGAYLVAFLAMFVRVAGSHFWRLLCYLIFHSISGQSDEHSRSWKQQKAVLRNDFSSTTSSMKFIAIARRSKDERPKRSASLALASIGILNAIAFMLAGLFSSAVTQRSSSVLLRPSVCGQWANLAEVTANHWDTKAVIEGVHFASMMRQGLITSSRLFRTCNESSSLQENCFALGNWPLWPSPTNVACPFGSELCAIDNAVIVDSGYLNSRSHLGINSPRGDSVNFRRTATCAPLRTAGLTSNVALRDDQGDVQVLDESFVGYNFGRNILLGTNSTYSYSNSNHSEASLGVTVDKWSYELDVEVAAFVNSTDDSSLRNSSSFRPLEKLRRPYSNTVLTFLVKRAKYLSPVLDPWYRAETPQALVLPISATKSKTIDVFISKDEPVSVLACFEQVELCNPNGFEQPCTLVPVNHHLINFIGDLGFNEKQKGVAQRIFRGLTRSALAQTIYSLGSQGLLASSTIQTVLPSPAVVEHQWKLEVRNWFGASLAGLQLLAIQDITGYGNSDFDQYITAYPDHDEWMCESQVVHRSDFASFSVLGLCIILFVGCFIIVLSEGLHYILPLLRYRNTASLRRFQEWRSFDILELASALRMGSVHLPDEPQSPDSVSHGSKFQTTYVDVSADAKG